MNSFTYVILGGLLGAFISVVVEVVIFYLLVIHKSNKKED